MPGLRSYIICGYKRRKMLVDWELLCAIAYPIFELRLALTTAVVQRRFFREWKQYVPFKELLFPDLISYLATVRGIMIRKNEFNGNFQIVADEKEIMANLSMVYLLVDGDED